MEESIFAPESLLTALKPFRKDRQLATILFWWLIDGWAISETDDDGIDWKPILDRYFEPITKSTGTRAKARKWLEENGFIEIRKTVCDNGISRNLRIKGKTPQQYRVTSQGPLVPYVVQEKPVVDYLLYADTGSDAASQNTRKNLGLLRKKEKTWEEEKNMDEKHWNRDQQSMILLENNLGKVGRGYKVNRLYSPFATARRPVRKLFKLGDEEIRAFDLRAAQPTLMGNLARDEKLLRACQSDELYQGIARAMGVSRDEAKQAFYCYSFGPIRTVRTGRPEALLVQEFMADNYPITASYVTSQKQPDHRKFAIQMQNLEASIFVDGIFAELSTIGIDALTVHDSIYVGDKDSQQARDVTEQHLKKNIIGGIFSIQED